MSNKQRESERSVKVSVGLEVTTSLVSYKSTGAAFTETSSHNNYKHHLRIYSIGNDTGRSAQDKVLV